MLRFRLRRNYADFILVTLRFVFAFLTFLCHQPGLAVHHCSFGRIPKHKIKAAGVRILQWLSGCFGAVAAEFVCSKEIQKLRCYLFFYLNQQDFGQLLQEAQADNLWQPGHYWT